MVIVRSKDWWLRRIDLEPQNCTVGAGRDSDRSGEAGETRSGSTEGESAGLQGIAPNNPKEPTP